jgi:peptidyl-prolyl cis-trans isomerase SurA
VGEISDPFEGQDENGNIVFKIIKLKSEIPAHRANLEEDFDRIKQMAKQTQQQEIISNWLDKKQKDTYIHIDPSFNDCNIRLGSRQ